MRNIGQSTLQNLLFVLFLFALTGCGASSSNLAATDGAASAKVTAKFVWAADGKSTAKTVASVPTGVLTVRLKVTGPYQIPGNSTTASRYTTTKASFPAAAGGGTVAVSPGTKLTVNAEALGAGDVLLYEGFVRNVDVVAGVTKDLGTITMTAPYFKQAEVTCLGCHENSRSVSGDSLVAEYKGSRHYARTVSPVPNYGVNSTGCAGCHGMNHENPNPAAGVWDGTATGNRCFECHNAGPNLITALGHKQSYKDNNTACTACHQAHSLAFQQALDLPASGHGTPTQPAWNDRDFSASADCNACHTPSGFKQAVASTWTNTAATNTGKSALTCDTCHSSATFYQNNIRAIGAYTAGMGGFGTAAKATVQYQDVNQSNVCVPCHATRENGKSLTLGVADFSNASFKNPHYLGAAAVFYGQAGFQYYSSASQTPYAAQAYTSKYGVVVDGTVIKAAAASTSNSTPAISVGDVLVGEKAPWSHGKLGMNNFQTTKTTSVIDVKGNLVYSGTSGQCVACHLGPEQTHSFDAFKGAEATWAGTLKGCYGCHTSEDMKEVAELDEKPKYDAAMAFFQWQLAQNGAVYSEVYPYFYKIDGVTALKNWVATSTANGMVVPGANGPANMGAAMNFKVLKAEKGAHVHNRTFMKQLIFDSIQYLQTGVNTFSNRNIASGSTDPNGLINFSNYSTSLISSGKAGATTAIVRGYIVRKNTAAPTAGYYTRP
ncbi:MAG: hypothetical protein PHI31_07405 [Desulfuromonadaceae bacterium]|nr:hypothetical protein [Desulfuromonadaceae bacterium]